MPFALAGFTEVEQVKPGIYQVYNFARDGELISHNLTNLPEVSAANVTKSSTGVVISK
jgi:hypothetical protein